MYCIASVLNHISWTKKYRTGPSWRSIALKLNDLCKVRNSAGHFAWMVFRRMMAWFKFYTSALSILKNVNDTKLHVAMIIQKFICLRVNIFWIYSNQMRTHPVIDENDTYFYTYLLRLFKTHWSTMVTFLKLVKHVDFFVDI